MSSFININGKLQPADEAALLVNNRAFRYGYGLFETMLVREGRIRLEELHWQRLFDGLTLLQIPVPKYFREELVQQVSRTITKNKLEKLCRLRLQVSAGDGGLYDEDSFAASYVMEAFPQDLSILDLNEAGLVVGIADAIKTTGDYAHLKTCSALPYALAARQAKKSQWNDALLLNEYGRLVESSIANLFWIKDGNIYTPPLSEGCIAGVMRQYLLRFLPESGHPVFEHAAERTALNNADAIFISSSLRGIRWIGSMNLIEYTPANIPQLHSKLLKSL